MRALDPAGGGGWELVTLTNDGLLGYGRSGGSDGHRVVADLAVALPTMSDGAGRTRSSSAPASTTRPAPSSAPKDVRRAIERALLALGRQSYLTGIIGAARCVGAPRAAASPAGSSLIAA